MNDARFEDGGESPLRLKAMDGEDIPVLSALVQDSVFPASEIVWKPRERRFAILLNRFRWEDVDRANARRRPVERVQSVLVFDDILGVRSQGVPRDDKDMVLSLLNVAWEASEDGTGRYVLTLAGDGAIMLDAEAIEVTLRDVTRPYVAPSRQTPSHPE